MMKPPAKRAKKPSYFQITRLQYAEVHPEKNPKLNLNLVGQISLIDAKRLRNWLTSYLKWERKIRGE